VRPKVKILYRKTKKAIPILPSSSFDQAPVLNVNFGGNVDFETKVTSEEVSFSSLLGCIPVQSQPIQ